MQEEQNPQSASLQTPSGTIHLKFDRVLKRDGSYAPFDVSKIEVAAHKAMVASGEGSLDLAKLIAGDVVRDLVLDAPEFDGLVIPHVEKIQDLVEKHLVRHNLAKAAKSFIIYRFLRTNVREANPQVNSDIKDSFRKNQQYFSSALSEFVYYRTYSRWQEEKGRREYWEESVDRFVSFMKENLGSKLTEQEYEDVHQAILLQRAIPSMRLLWSSGPAARATNVAAYNCSFVAIGKLRDFAEMMYISMCGCGVGFSVEKKAIDRLPEIQPQSGEHLGVHTVQDSKEGWADAFLAGLEAWFAGKDIDFDYSLVRQKGARLKTMGGRASGPDPLVNLMSFAKGIILENQGRKLSSINVHDIACKIGEIVVAGGVRRSAMISLSDLDDPDMRQAKHGQFWNTHPHRSMANNSATYDTKPAADVFMREWLSLIESNSGERGIFNRGGLKDQLPARRWNVFEPYAEFGGTNPCGEIILRSKQFCNLTAIIVRADDTLETLKDKIKQATILGTYQASLTKFPYLSEEWTQNCQEEALLGVSFTGYYDNKTVREPAVLQELRDYAVAVNKEYAARFGINQSTSVTCVKPSGNSSQLLDTSSGMHPRYSAYYVRRVRVNATDPLFRMLKDQGVPYHPEVGQSEDTATSFVLEFPVKSPDGAIVKDDVTALALLEEWKKIKENFVEHNPSATIYVGPGEWIEVGNWVYNNWDIIGGLTFLPRTDHVYELAPYEEITEQQYLELKEKVKGIDFSKLLTYEQTDNTQGAKEYACIGGACDII